MLLVAAPGSLVLKPGGARETHVPSSLREIERRREDFICLLTEPLALGSFHLPFAGHGGTGARDAGSDSESLQSLRRAPRRVVVIVHGLLQPRLAPRAV